MGERDAGGDDCGAERNDAQPAGEERTSVAYKILTAREAADMRRAGVFRGSPVDLADGFIHMSTAAQLAETMRRHFAGQTDLVIATVDLARLGEAVRWEASRGGQLFPHLYATLPTEAVTAWETTAQA